MHTAELVCTCKRIKMFSRYSEQCTTYTSLNIEHGAPTPFILYQLKVEIQKTTSYFSCQYYWLLTKTSVLA